MDDTTSNIDRFAPMPHPLAGALAMPFWNEFKAGSERNRLAESPVVLPPAEGRRVVLVCGFLAGASNMDIMADWLREGGYEVTIAEVGRNASTSGRAVSQIVGALESGTKPGVLIGHSRGGQQCRVVALRRPELVEQLITLGAPVRTYLPRNVFLRTSIEALRLLGRPSIEDKDAEELFEQDLASPFNVGVPWTSILSKQDGVVEWQACVDPAAICVAVSTSHAGLIASAPSFEAIAAALVVDRSSTVRR